MADIEQIQRDQRGDQRRPGDPAAQPLDMAVVAADQLSGGPKLRRVVTNDVHQSINDVIKFIDDNTGFTELAMDPSNSSTLYAASYQRRRSGCCFNGGGPGIRSVFP